MLRFELHPNASSLHGISVYQYRTYKRISSKNQTGLCMMMAHSPLIDIKLTHYTYIQMHTGKDQNMYGKKPDWQNKH